MWRLRGRRFGLAFILLAVALGMFLLSRLLINKGLDWAAEFSGVASLLLGILGVVIAPFGRITRWARGPQPPTPEDVEKARINLQAALSGAWSEDGSEVYEDLPMRVRFAGLAPAQFQSGDFGSVAEAFSQVPRYRRVILGEAGSGKTVLVTELQRSLVEAPQRGDPLPVIVPAAAWRPDRQPLLDWLAQQLADDYGWLPVAHARALVARGLVLPILDGLDEMPGSLRPDAIARINKYHVYRPLIVTSRESEYHDAVLQTRAGIKASTVVAVQPLQLADTKAYLDAADGGEWTQVLGEMGAHDDSVLAGVLANPLMLWLAHVEYEDESPDHLTLFGSRSALEDFLLSQFVPSVYADDSSPAAAGHFGCTAQQAKRWLGNLAADIYQQYSTSRPARENEQEVQAEGPGDDIGGAPVLAWWEIGGLAGRWRQLGIALRGAVLCGVGLPLGIWVLAQHGNWRHGTYKGPVNYGNLFLSGPVGRLIRPTAQRLVPAAQKTNRKGVLNTYIYPVYKFLLPVLREILSHPFLMIPAVAFLILIVAPTSHLGTSRVPMRLQLNAKAIFGVLFIYCTTFGVATLMAFLTLRWAHWPVSMSVFFSSRSTWIALLTVPLLGSHLLQQGGLTSRSDASGTLSPDESLRLDRQADAVVTIVKQSGFAVGVGLICSRPVAVAYIVYAIASTLEALALGGQQRAASRCYVDARNWLAVRGRVPWRTMTFLADANRRGVLRQVGAAYQFRHIRLLEQVRYWRSDSQGRPEDGRPEDRRLEDGPDHLGELVNRLPGASGRRREQMLKAWREEAKRHRRTAQAGLDVLPPELPAALDNLAGRLRWHSDEPARAALRDVLDAYRTLAETDPVAFGPGLAQVLKLSARAFRWDEALRVSEEAVSCYRELAPADPARFLPALAKAVSDLGGRLGPLGRREEALTLTIDMIETLRNRAEADPAAFRPALAHSLSDLGDRLAESKRRPEESDSAWQEAAASYRELAAADPARYAGSLTSSLLNLASSYRAQRRAPDELAAIRDAINACRERTTRIHEVRRQIAPTPAKPASGRGRGRSHRQEALAAARNAAAACAQLAQTPPAEFLLDLAVATQGLADELVSAGEPQAARILAAEADRIRGQYRRSAQITPRQAREVPLPHQIDGLALRLWKLGQIQDARTAARISLDLAHVRPADTAAAPRGRAWLRRLLSRLRERQQVRGPRNRVRSLTQKVVALQPTARRSPETQGPLIQARQELAAALEDQSDVLDTLAFRRLTRARAEGAFATIRRFIKIVTGLVTVHRAVRTQERAVASYRRTYRMLPASNRPGLAGALAAALDTLAIRLKADSRPEEAATATSQASKMRQRDHSVPEDEAPGTPSDWLGKIFD